MNPTGTFTGDGIRSGLLRLLVELNRNGQDVLIATHDLGLYPRHQGTGCKARCCDRETAASRLAGADYEDICALRWTSL